MKAMASFMTGKKKVPQKSPFGVPIDDVMKRASEFGNLVPSIVKDAAEIVERNLDEEGLYRVNGSVAEVNALVELYERNAPDRKAKLEQHPTVAVCGLLKKFLSLLPEPLLTTGMRCAFINCASVEPDMRIQMLKHLVKSIRSVATTNLLRFLFRHLANVASHQEKNRMSEANLATVFGPVLLLAKGELSPDQLSELGDISCVVQTMIHNVDEIFPTPLPASLCTKALPSTPTTPLRCQTPATPLSPICTPTQPQRYAAIESTAGDEKQDWSSGEVVAKRTVDSMLSTPRKNRGQTADGPRPSPKRRRTGSFGAYVEMPHRESEATISDPLPPQSGLCEVSFVERSFYVEDDSVYASMTPPEDQEQEPQEQEPDEQEQQQNDQPAEQEQQEEEPQQRPLGLRLAETLGDREDDTIETKLARRQHHLEVLQVAIVKWKREFAMRVGRQPGQEDAKKDRAFLELARERRLVNIEIKQLMMCSAVQQQQTTSAMPKALPPSFLMMSASERMADRERLEMEKKKVSGLVRMRAQEFTRKHGRKPSDIELKDLRREFSGRISEINKQLLYHERAASSSN